MKNLVVAIFTGLIPSSLMAVPPYYIQKWTAAYDGPQEVVNHNTSSGSNAMTEVRTLNNGGCAHDLGVVGTNYSDPLDNSIKQNEAFLVSESTCAGMLIKQNSDTYIRFSLGGSPTEKVRITRNETQVMNDGDANLNVVSRRPPPAVEVRTGILSDNGNGYVGTRTDHPMHLMVKNDAWVTVHKDGKVELWKSANCPGKETPANGGFLCVDGQGSLWYTGPSGRAKQLAGP
jgi:hypothetical protein